MNSFEINDVIKSDPISAHTFLGVYPIDCLPQPKQKPSSVIINLDPSYQPGSHWVCCQLNQNGPSYYFDSYGKLPQIIIQKYLLKNSQNGYEQSTERLQAVLSSVCGIYCIYCIVNWARGYTLNDIVNRFEPDNQISNDHILTAWLEELFDCYVPTYDISNIQLQVSRALQETDLL